MIMKIITGMLIAISLSCAQAKTVPPADTTNLPANTGQPAPPVNQINTNPAGTLQNTNSNSGNTNSGIQYTNSGKTEDGSMMNNPDNMAWKNDTTFVIKAGDGGMLEYKLGQLALTRSSNSKVKELAQMMITDHGKANKELKTLALKKGIKIGASLSKKSQLEYDQLAKKTGADFDKAYAKMMVDDHKKDIALFKDAEAMGRDADIKNWASGKIPTLQHHLEMAEETLKAIK
jgi:putative membrane protein